MLEQEVLKELQKMNKLLSDTMRGTSSLHSMRNDSANHNRSSNSRAPQYTDRYDKDLKKFQKESLKDAASSLSSLSKTWKQSARSMDGLSHAIDMTSGGMISSSKQAARLVDGMSRFTSSIAKTAKAQSLLYAQQMRNIGALKDYEKVAYYDEVRKSLEGLDAGTKRSLGILDEATGKLKANLDFSEAAEIRKTLGEVNASMMESLKSVGFDDLGSLVKSIKAGGADVGGGNASNERDAFLKIAAELQARGVLTPTSVKSDVIAALNSATPSEALNNLDMDELTRAVEKFHRGLTVAAAGLDKTVDAFTNPLRRASAALKNTEGRLKAFENALAYITSGIFLAKAKSANGELYRGVRDFNIAQIPASFLETNLASVALGLSMKDTVSLMAENKRMLAIYGPDQFRGAMGMLQQSFQRFGYNLEQSKDIIAPAIESAFAVGINIRDSSALNGFTNTLMNSFQSISGIVNISAKQFADMNSQLFNSEEVFKTLQGMDTSRRAAYAQEMVQLREKYFVNGMTLEQAQKQVELGQQQQRQAVQERLGDGAKLMTLASALGMGETGVEIFNLSRKKRTAEEDAIYSNLLGSLGKTAEERIRSGYGESGLGGAGMALEYTVQNLMPSGAIGEMMTTSMRGQAIKAAGGAPTLEEQKIASARAAGNVNVAEVSQAVNQVSSLFKNDLVQAVYTSAGALVSLTISALGLTKKFASMSLGNSLGGGVGAGGKGGGALGKIVNAKTMGAIGVGGAGMAASVLGEKLGGTTGAITDILGNVISGASVGMMTGNPLIGLAGGLGGLAYGAYSNWGAIKGAVTPTFATPTMSLPVVSSSSTNTPAGDSINTTSVSGILDVRDSLMLEQIKQLTASMNAAVSILQKIHDKPPLELASSIQPDIKMKNPPIPSAYAFTSGRNGS